jgi:hypothetical protein
MKFVSDNIHCDEVAQIRPMDVKENTCFNLHFNIIISSSLGIYSLRPSSFSTEILLNLLSFCSHSCHMLIPSHLPLFNYSVQVYLRAGSIAQGPNTET